MEESQEMKNEFKEMMTLWGRATDACNKATGASFVFLYKLLKEAGPIKFTGSEPKVDIAYLHPEDCRTAVGVIKELYISEDCNEDAKAIMESLYGTTETIMVEFVDGNKTDFFYLNRVEIIRVIYHARVILNL